MKQAEVVDLEEREPIKDQFPKGKCNEINIQPINAVVWKVVRADAMWKLPEKTSVL